MPSPTEQTVERLPCRGCMRDCPYFYVCDGKLWRMPVDRQGARVGDEEDAQPGS